MVLSPKAPAAILTLAYFWYRIPLEIGTSSMPCQGGWWGAYYSCNHWKVMCDSTLYLCMANHRCPQKKTRLDYIPIEGKDMLRNYSTNVLAVWSCIRYLLSWSMNLWDIASRLEGAYGYLGIFARLTVDLLRAQGTTSGTVVFSPSTETLDSGRYVAWKRDRKKDPDP